jgi:polar amino acid transport system substrate-binding protein
MAVVAAFAMLFTAGCSKARTLDEIKQSGELIMYCSATWPPYEFMRGSEVVGVEVEIGNAIAADLGVKLKITNADFDGFPMAIKRGRADIGLSTITVTEERKKEMIFSVSYSNGFNKILKAKSDTSINFLDDLSGKAVGDKLGTTGDFMIENGMKDGILSKDTKNIQLKSVQEAFLSLKSGSLNAVIGDGCVLDILATANPDYEAIPAARKDGTLVKEEYAAAFNMSNTELRDAANKTIERLMIEGKIDAWYQQYAAEAGKQEAEKQNSPAQDAAGQEAATQEAQ